MTKRLFSLVGAAAICSAVVFAQDSKLTIPVKPTPANDGKVMYVNYCAPCHGLDGRGHGPTATVLTVAPADLAMLSKNNNGAYPAVHVVAILKFGVENAAHGSKAMPIWGPALRSDRPSGVNEEETLRIANLVKYVETLQVK